MLSHRQCPIWMWQQLQQLTTHLRVWVLQWLPMTVLPAPRNYQRQLGSRRLMCSYKAMISPSRTTCCNWINRNRGLTKAWSWRDGSKSSGLKNQSGGPGTRLRTRKLWKRSTETGSWPRASLEVETMRSTVRGHPAQGWSLLTLKGPCSSGQSSVWSCQPKFSQIVLGSSQNRSRTVSLTGIEIKAPRCVHTHL